MTQFICKKEHAVMRLNNEFHFMKQGNIVEVYDQSYEFTYMMMYEQKFKVQNNRFRLCYERHLK